MPYNVDYNSRVPEDSPDATQNFQDQQHHHGVKGSLEKAADKVKNAFTSNKEEHDHAYQSGATEPVPMSSDPRVEPHHRANLPESVARRDNVHAQDNIYGSQAPQVPMSSDPRVEPHHSANLPAGVVRRDNVHAQDNIYGSQAPQYPSK